MTCAIDHDVDLLIIGGGINGAGIARDAAGRGLKVLLCEKNDLGSATSSASSKLVHGGLRYLENYEFRLVREALAEREKLLGIAPHISHPLRFILPHDASLRPKWMIRIGLFLYDHLAKRSRLPGSGVIDFRNDPTGSPLKADVTHGFSYFDGWIDDSRLVILNAMDAAAHGAIILPRWELIEVNTAGTHWLATLLLANGQSLKVQARTIVNAAGPWAGKIFSLAHGRDHADPLRLVKGSHIIVPRLYDGDHAYILQNTDKRVIFTIPYEQNFTIVGTTDIPFSGDPAHVTISDEETRYLCAAVNRWFKRPISPQDAVSSYAGVRPLYDDEADNPSAVTRDYVLDLKQNGGGPALLSVFGGKLTTYRRLAEHALEKLTSAFPNLSPAWTAEKPLPGGDVPRLDMPAFEQSFSQQFPWLPKPLADRYCRNYGTRARTLLNDARDISSLGRHLGAGLYEREMEYLIDHEWAQTADDILWRRTKLGLHGGSELTRNVQEWLAQRGQLRSRVKRAQYGRVQ